MKSYQVNMIIYWNLLEIWWDIGDGKNPSSTTYGCCIVISWDLMGCLRLKKNVGIQPLKNGGISRGYFMWKPFKNYAIISFIIWDTIFTHSGCGCENGPLKYAYFFDGDFSRFFPPEKNEGWSGCLDQAGFENLFFGDSEDSKLHLS